MVAERVGAFLHRMMAARIRVPAQVTVAAFPPPVQLLETAFAQAAVWAGEAPSVGARVVEIDARVSVVLDVVGDVLAGKLGAGGLVDGGGRAVDVV